ncbi:MAG: PorT family protein [Muribaculaceae bacterium]|nr:PorT family protein [Muribaculaceae bacterium]
MKHLFPFALLLGLVASPVAAAQDIFDNPDNAPYLGARLSLDITCPTDLKTGDFKIDLYNPGAGFEAGIIYNIPLWKNLYFEPGLNLFYSTMKGSITTMDEYVPMETHYSARRFGFRVPLRAGYRFDFDFGSISVFTGPRLGIPLVGRSHYTIDKESDSSNLYGDGASFHRLDIGWQFGAGFSYGNWIFEISGTAGMLDMYKGPSSMHDNGVDLTFGYNF